MMKRQLIQWTLLPAGLTPDGHLAASVFVAPRLQPGTATTLADFPDFLDWPTTLEGLDLAIVRPDGVIEAPQEIFARASSSLWTALFPPTTTVRSFHFEDLADRPIVSYPVNEVLSYLSSCWATLAYEAHADLPVTNSNASPIGGLQDQGRESPFTLSRHFKDLWHVGRREIFEGVESAEDFSDRLRSRLDDVAADSRKLREVHHTTKQDLIRPFGAGGSPTDAFYALLGFHARPMREEPKIFPASPQQLREELAEQLDFHHFLSVLGDHPELLRQLGLVIDLEIRADFVPTTAEGDPPTPLRLQVTRPSAFPPRRDNPAAEVWNADVTPATLCRSTEIAGQAFFTAGERAGRQDFTHGFVHLDPLRYSATTLDVDGLALKALNMAVTLQRQEEQKNRPLDEPARDGVPVPRTGGVALVRTNAADDLHMDFYAARAANDALENDPDNPSDLAAGDLVRGYRLDVFTNDSWHSLHERSISYTPQRSDVEQIDVVDEGHLQPSVTAEADRPGQPADPDRPLYLHEALMTWDGWSLAVPRPGTAINQEPTSPESAEDLTTLNLGISTDPLPGSLPRLRFGSEYRLRARTVDLAGNAHTRKTADNLYRTLEDTGDPRYTVTTPPEPLIYRRFEPVPPPELIPRWDFGPGEGLERLVIRSTPGLTAAEYAAASQGETDEMLRFRAVAERHMAAAKASLQLVETHGMLDEAIDAVREIIDPAAAAVAVQQWYDVASRENGSPHDLPGARFVVTGTHKREDTGEEEEQGYICLDADTFALPWLPDPFGTGAKLRLRLDPELPEEILDLRYSDEGTWYTPRPLRLRLQEGPRSHVDWDPVQNLVTVFLPPGRTGVLRLSSLFENDPELFGIMEWCRRHLTDSQYEVVLKEVTAGMHWMTTPWRDLLLVHAVQRPVEDPQLELYTPEATGFTGHAVLIRGRGETTAHLRGLFTFDRPSTAQLDLEATWEEWADNIKPSYENTDSMAHTMRHQVLSLPVPDPSGTQWQPEVALLVQPLDERVVEFATRDPEGGTAETYRQMMLKEASIAGVSTQDRHRFEAAAAQVEQLRGHQFNDTRYRRVTYVPVASTRFREYFNPALPSSELQAVGPAATVDILSSAPPEQPTVLQMLPLLTYEQQKSGDLITSHRQGPGLRVWLARPWFSSGAGELLAVVCSGEATVTDDSKLSREITLIVGDPTHGSELPLPLLARSFEGADLVVPNVPLAGSNLRRDIAAFKPIWDEGRQSWYVDLQFSTGEAYFPFVRLGLARYQPMSVEGCELSPITSTVFVQTVPDRTLTCTFNDREAVLTLSGPAPTSRIDADGTEQTDSNEVVATIERQSEGFTDPLLGWEAVGPEVPLIFSHAPGTAATWSGTVPLPLSTPGARQRIVVREFELHPTDDRSTDPSIEFILIRRFVYADFVPL